MPYPPLRHRRGRKWVIKAIRFLYCHTLYKIFRWYYELPAAILVTAEVLIIQIKYLVFRTASFPLIFHLFVFHNTYIRINIFLCLSLPVKNNSPSYSLKDTMPSDTFPGSDNVTTNSEIVAGEKLWQVSSFYSEVLILATLYNECHS